MKKKQFSIFGTIMFIILGVWSISIIFLLLWSVLSSLKSWDDFRTNPLGLPAVIKFENYVNIFRDLKVPVTKVGYLPRDVYLPELFLNSIIYALGCTICYVITRALVAYACARYKFFLAKILITINLLVMIIPVVGRLPGELRIMRELGFYDNIFALCIMKGSFSGMDFLILLTAFSSISKDYSEAAFIDGASHSRVMWTIMFPMVKQILFILALSAFIGYWNEWSVTLTYMPSYPTAAYALYVFKSSNNPAIVLGGTPYIFCACVTVMVPILILFAIFHKQLLGGIDFGGVKG